MERVLAASTRRVVPVSRSSPHLQRGEDHHQTSCVGIDYEYSLLATYSSELLHLSTNNGEHCLSDTIRTGDFAPDVSMKRVAPVSKSLVSVIFVSGGFGADFTQISVLATYMLDLLHFPTTNEEHCTGDAIEMVGPGHSTGLVKPDDPDSKDNFLAAEGSPRSWCVLFSTHTETVSPIRAQDLWMTKVPLLLW